MIVGLLCRSDSRVLRVDGGMPKRIDFPFNSIHAYDEFPHELWERIIDK